jgi:hypothetical protein
LEIVLVIVLVLVLETRTEKRPTEKAGWQKTAPALASLAPFFLPAIFLPFSLNEGKTRGREEIPSLLPAFAVPLLLHPLGGGADNMLVCSAPVRAFPSSALPPLTPRPRPALILAKR